MELLVATWTLRIALIGALLVAGISVSAGATMLDAVERAVIASFALTLLGRKLIGWLQTPEQRMLKLRAKREAARKGPKAAPEKKTKDSKPAPAKKSKKAAPDPKRSLAPDATASATP